MRGKSPASRLFWLLVSAVCLVAAVFATPVHAAKTTKAGVSKAAVSKAAKSKAAKSTKTTKPSGPKRPDAAALSRRLASARAERARVLARRAKVASRVSALSVSNKQATQALVTLNRNVKSQTAAVGDARRDADEASREARDARAKERATVAKIQVLRSTQATAALNEYTTSSVDDLTFDVGPDAILIESARGIYADVAGRRSADTLDQLRSLNEDLTISRVLADRAEKRASARRKAYETRLRGLRDARTQQARVASSSEARLEAALAEAAAVSAIDSALAARITADNGALAAQLAAAKYTGRGGGPSVVVGNISVGSTNGIVVATAIRGQVASMIAAAAADGVTLRGGGYRSSALQVALRRAHCGGGTFAIYQMRASSCRPPTARPGQSMHERGLAIDFADSRGSLTRSSAGYRWLRANAHRFGLKNLPSEPWHWSVNGK